MLLQRPLGQLVYKIDAVTGAERVKQFGLGRLILTPQVDPQNHHPTGRCRTTRDELRLAIITWIEHTYNRRRRQRWLGKLTPIEFELALHNRHLEVA